jgi:hypothetical protein
VDRPPDDQTRQRARDGEGSQGGAHPRGQGFVVQARQVEIANVPAGDQTGVDRQGAGDAAPLDPDHEWGQAGTLDGERDGSALWPAEGRRQVAMGVEHGLAVDGDD